MTIEKMCSSFSGLKLKIKQTRRTVPTQRAVSAATAASRWAGLQIMHPKQNPTRHAEKATNQENRNYFCSKKRKTKIIPLKKGNQKLLSQKKENRNYSIIILFLSNYSIIVRNQKARRLLWIGPVFYHRSFLFFFSSQVLVFHPALSPNLCSSQSDR